jgi:hypothetical protein
MVDRAFFNCLLDVRMQSLLKSRVISLQESFEGDAHVLVFELLSKLVTQLLNAVVFERSVEMSLLLCGHAQHHVRVNVLCLLPEVLSSF